MALDVIYKNRNGTTAEWAASTYILLKGEMGVDTDLNIAKIGDGVHTWKDLDIFNKTDTSGFVTLSTSQIISGDKTFSVQPTMVGVTFKRGSETLEIKNDGGWLIEGSTPVSGVSYPGKIYFPDGDGTLALTSDIPTNYVTTNTAQTITGSKTFNETADFGNGISVGISDSTDRLNIGVDSENHTGIIEFTSDDVAGSSLTLPNGIGTLALTSDIPTNYVTIDTTQTISGAKTFSKAVSVNTDLTAGFEITGGGNTWKINARTEEGPLNIVGQGATGANTYQFPDKTGTIALTSDIPDPITNYVTTNTAQNITAVKSFRSNVQVINASSTGIITLQPDGIIDMLGGGMYTFNIDATKKQMTVGATGTNTVLHFNPNSNTVEVPNKSGTIALTEDVPDLHRVDDSFTTSVWQTSTAAVDTQFGKYYYDCAIGEAKHYTIRVTSPYGLTTTTDLDFYPEVKCNNRCVGGSSNNFVRIYSNVKIAGTYDCIYW